VQFYFLTFANSSQRVNVELRPDCGFGPSNGQFEANAAGLWLADLQPYMGKP
jgi:hypothetical protein